MTEQNKTENADYILGVLIHELAHQFNAIDHYHEMVIDGNGNSICKNKPYCSDPLHDGDPDFQQRPGWCIMNNDTNANIKNESITRLFCTACKNDIFTHLNKYK